MALKNFNPEAGKKKGQEEKKKKNFLKVLKTGETCLLKRTLKVSVGMEISSPL